MNKDLLSENIDAVKAAIETATTEEKNTALYKAAGHGRNEITQLLLEAGADVHYKQDAALRMAWYYTEESTVALLLKHGANKEAIKYQCDLIAGYSIDSQE